MFHQLLESALGTPIYGQQHTGAKLQTPENCFTREYGRLLLWPQCKVQQALAIWSRIMEGKGSGKTKELVLMSFAYAPAVIPWA